MANSRIRRVSRLAAMGAFSALLFFVAFSTLFPPSAPEIFDFMPPSAVAIGYHRDLRSTWKSQILHPTVASILAGYDIDARKASKESGAVWTFRLAIGDEVASSLLLREGEFPCLAAASPTGRRDFLLHIFWHIRWIPGLGRIRTSADGVRYVDLTDDDEPDAMPLILSIRLRRGILLAKLSNRPVALDDMTERNTGVPTPEFPESMRSDLPEGFLHRISIRNGMKLHNGFVVDRQIVLDISRQERSIRIDAAMPITRRDAAIRFLLASKLTGGNAAVDALASAHAFTLALLPQKTAATLASRLPFVKTFHQAHDDAAIYLTGAPYGASLYMFAIPAITASIPGMQIDEASLQTMLRRTLPRKIRSGITLFGEDGICSSAASLRQQRHAAPPPSFTWHDSFAHFKDNPPSAFVYIDCDPFFREFRQLAQASALAASFAKEAIAPGVVFALKRIAEFLPMLPTGSHLSLAASSQETETFKISGILEASADL